MAGSSGIKAGEVADKLTSLRREVSLFIQQGGLTRMQEFRLTEFLDQSASTIKELRSCAGRCSADQQPEISASPGEVKETAGIIVSPADHPYRV